MTKASLLYPADLYDGLDEHGNAEGLAQLEVLPPDQMLREFKDINVAAPMVRYSKLPARYLFSRYDCHIVNTPMMMAREFTRSQKARESDFSTDPHERGLFNMNGRRIRGALVAQFAAHNGKEFADAVEMIHNDVDGADLNCGCPQTWAYKDEVGSYLLRQPHLVHDMVKTARGRVSTTFPISIKIRLDKDSKNTSQLIQTAIHAGVSYIGVHGRTRHQRDSEPVNLEGMKFAREEAKGQVPIIGNGDVFTLRDAVRMREVTGVQGAMSARGLLSNPALFSGYEKTPFEAVERFIGISRAFDLQYPLFSRHIAWMLEKHTKNKLERASFNELKTYEAGVNWVNDFIAQKRNGIFNAASSTPSFSIGTTHLNTIDVSG